MYVCIFTSCLLLPCVSRSKVEENGLEDSLCPHLCRYVHVYSDFSCLGQLADC